MPCEQLAPFNAYKRFSSVITLIDNSRHIIRSITTSTTPDRQFNATYGRYVERPGPQVARNFVESGTPTVL